MISARHFLSILLVSLTVIVACEEAENPAKEVSSPQVKIDFIAEASLEEIELVFEDNDSIADTLFTIYLKYAEENSFDTLEALIEYNEQLLVLDSIRELKSLLSSKKVLLDSVYALQSNGFVILDTINSVFKLPLKIDADSSVFVFSYLKKKDTLTVYYKMKVQAGLDQISIVAYDIDVISTFDRYSRHFCHEENCTSNEIVFKVYF